VSSRSLTTLATQIKNKARLLGFDAVGIVPVGQAPHGSFFVRWIDQGFHGEMEYLARRIQERCAPRRLWPEARSLIVLGLNYFTSNLPLQIRNDPARGIIASYAWGQDYHEVIRPRLFELDRFVRSQTGRIMYGKAYVDTGPVLERDWAMQAGLGFIGKSTCLISSDFGPWLFLAVLVVPEELAYDLPPKPLNLAFDVKAWRLPDGSLGSCGACTRCLDACPTKALIAPYTLNARRCISYLTIELRGPIPHDLRPLVGNRVFGCDECQAVCPWARRFAHPTREPALQPRSDIAAPKLLDLIGLTEEQFQERFRGSPVKRAKRRGVLRNVAVALGNWGDPRAVSALEAALHDREPLVRGHAAWALGRIGGKHARVMLQAATATEQDTYVREEIRLALSQA